MEKNEPGRAEGSHSQLHIFVNKIMKYTREANFEKLEHYMKAIRQETGQKYNRKNGIEVTIRKTGGIQAMATVVKKVMERAKADPEFMSQHSDLLITTLTLMGNAFAVDYGARQEVIKNNFLLTIQEVLKRGIDQFNSELLHRGLKCLGNLLFESGVRGPALRIGLIETVFLVIDQTQQNVQNSLKRPEIIPNESRSSRRRSIRIQEQALPPCATTVNELSPEHESVLLSAVRCIRICAGDEDSRSYLCRPLRMFESEKFTQRVAPSHMPGLNCILELGKILTWPEVETWSEKVMFEVLYALTTITENMSLVPYNIIEEIVTPPSARILRAIMEIFRNSTIASRVNLQSLRVITNFVCNKDIAFEFIPLGLYDVLFKQIRATTDTSTLARQLTLFEKTVRKGNDGNSLIVRLMPLISVKRSAEHNICSTLRVLQSDELKRFHYFLLQAYAALSESCLTALCQAGLLEIIEMILHDVHGKVTYEDLMKRTEEVESQLDTGHCSQHCSNSTQKCHFAQAKPPCTEIPVQPVPLPSDTTVNKVNPGKQLIVTTEDVKTAYSDSNSIESYDQGYFSMSPASPRSSSPGGASGWSNDSFDEGISNASASEDECCYSPLAPETSDMDSPRKTPSLAEGKSHKSKNETPGRSTPNKARLRSPDGISQGSPKRLKLSSELKEYPTEEGFLIETRNVFDNINNIRMSVVALRILRKIIYYPLLMDRLVPFTPLFLSLILSAKQSCINFDLGRNQPGSVSNEILQLSRQSFEAATDIVTNLFIDARLLANFLEKNVISTVYKIVVISPDLMKPIFSENQSQSDICSAKLRKLLPILSGLTSKSAGYRESVINQSLRQSRPSSLQNQAAIAIPLIYNYDDSRYRKFQNVMKSWDRLLGIFNDVDSVPDSLFEEAIVALGNIFTTIRVPMPDSGKYSSASQLRRFELPLPAYEALVLRPPDTEVVVLELDDETSLIASKEVLVNSTPVLSAMLLGNFLESKEQKVKIQGVSRQGLEAFLEQLEMAQTQTLPPANSPPVESNNYTVKYDVESVFDILQLSHKYVLTELYEKTINTILGSYLCPYTSAQIYERTMTMIPLDIWGTTVDENILQINFFVIKYILMEPTLSMRQRAQAMRNLFNSVEPSVIMKDIRHILFHYAEKNRPQVSWYLNIRDD